MSIFTEVILDEVNGAIRDYIFKEGQRPTMVLLSEDDCHTLEKYATSAYLPAHTTKDLKAKLYGLEIIVCLDIDKAKVVR